MCIVRKGERDHRYRECDGRTKRISSAELNQSKNGVQRVLRLAKGRVPDVQVFHGMRNEMLIQQEIGWREYFIVLLFA